MVLSEITGGGKRVMENTRSYMSRFSGLGLFLIALLVVGVLVWLTIRSANDESSQTANNTQTEQTDNNPVVADESTTTDSSTDEQTNSSQESDQVAGVITDTDIDNGNLPNTGPESVLISTIGLMAIVAVVTAYRRSLSDLQQSQL